MRMEILPLGLALAALFGRILILLVVGAGALPAWARPTIVRRVARYWILYAVGFALQWGCLITIWTIGGFLKFLFGVGFVYFGGKPIAQRILKVRGAWPPV